MPASDNFNRADDTELDGDTLSSGGVTWVKHTAQSTITGLPTGATLGILSNFVQTRSSPLDRREHTYYTSQDEGVNQFTEATLTFSAANRGGGVWGRLATGAMTGYLAYYYRAAGEWRLVEVVAGTGTQLGSYTQSLTDNVAYTMRIEINDARKEFFVDGVSRITATANNVASGRSGIFAIDGAEGFVYGAKIDSYSQGTVAAGASGGLVVRRKSPLLRGMYVR